MHLLPLPTGVHICTSLLSPHEAGEALLEMIPFPGQLADHVSVLS